MPQKAASESAKKKRPNESPHRRVAEFLYELGTLRTIVRSHRQLLLTNDLSDSIASHSYRVTWIGWLLAKMEGADPYKVVMMCLTHDTGEARSTDHNWLHKRYVKVFEDEIRRDQLGPLPFSKELFAITDEYNERQSLEAKIAKDADLLDQVLLLKEYEHQGNREAAKWLVGKREGKRFFTRSAKTLVKAVCDQTPGDWWEDKWTNVNR